MSTLIRLDDGQAAEYAQIADDVPLPPQGPVLVSLARWEQEAERLRAAGQAFAVRIPNTTNVSALPAALLEASTLVLEFPGFSDGRAYSQARLLREALGYRGELRATGAAVVKDQLLGMTRCGIDGFELRADQSAAACLEALGEFSLAYQPALDDRPRVRELRKRDIG